MSSCEKYGRVSRDTDYMFIAERLGNVSLPRALKLLVWFGDLSSPRVLVFEGCALAM